MEVWDDRSFQIETCCPGMHEAVTDFLADDPKAAAEWLNGLSDGILKAINGRGARRVIECDLQLLIDWHPRIVTVQQRVAKAFVRDHHRHCRPPAGWKFGAGITNGPGAEGLIGVVMVGRPVSRMLQATGAVEVNRLCIRDDVAPQLAWNACSLAYGWAAKQARARRIPKILTYTLESESGTSLRAAGWVPEAVSRGGSWNRPGRRRKAALHSEPKVRWAPQWCAQPVAKVAQTRVR